MAGARVVRLVTIPRVHSMMIHLGGGGGGNNGMKEMGKRVEKGEEFLVGERNREGERAILAMREVANWPPLVTYYFTVRDNGRRRSFLHSQLPSNNAPSVYGIAVNNQRAGNNPTLNVRNMKYLAPEEA